jgi:hypothetical protein
MGSNGGGFSVVLVSGDRSPPAEYTLEPPLEETRLGVSLHVSLNLSDLRNINAQRPLAAPLPLGSLPSKIRPETSGGAETPRGGDFLYNAEEFDTMLRDIEMVRDAGAGVPLCSPGGGCFLGQIVAISATPIARPAP